MNYEQIKQTQNSLPFIRYGLFFLFLQVLIAVVLLGLGLYFVVTNLSINWWLVLKLGLKLDLKFWLAIVVFCGGQFCLNLKLWEYWDNSFVDFQRGNYMSKPEYAKMTFKLIIPPNYNYTNHKIKILFAFFFNTFRANNININTTYNQGKYFHNISFDYIIEAGQIVSYVTFPKKMAVKVFEIFRIVFPEIKLITTKDPFSDSFFQNNLFDSQNIAGFSVASRYSNLMPPAPLQHLAKNQKQINDLLQYIKSNSAGQEIKYFVQYNFVFDDRISHKKYNDEFDVLLQELFEKYGAKKVVQSKFKDSSNLNEEMFHVMFPKDEQDRINIMFERLKNVWWYCALRVVAIQSNENVTDNPAKISSIEQVDDFLDTAFRTIFDIPSESQSPLEKKYLTATNQSYFNHKANFKTINQPETAHLYDNFYFPPPNIESYISPFYNNFYFPKENKYRSQQLYRTLLTRDVMAPWGGDAFLVDLNSITACFQIPI